MGKFEHSTWGERPVKTRRSSTSQGVPRIVSKPQEARNTLLRSLRGTSAANALMRTVGHAFLLLKPPRLWYFGNPTSGFETEREQSGAAPKLCLAHGRGGPPAKNQAMGISVPWREDRCACRSSPTLWHPVNPTPSCHSPEGEATPPTHKKKHA